MRGQGRSRNDDRPARNPVRAPAGERAGGMRGEVPARAEVEQVLNRICWGYDENDVDLIASLFTADARMSMRIGDRAGELVGPFEGRERIRQLHADSLASQQDQRRHQITNLWVAEESDGGATVVSNLVLHAVRDGQVRVLSTGWYRDRLVRTDDGWKVAERYLYLDLPY